MRSPVQRHQRRQTHSTQARRSSWLGRPSVWRGRRRACRSAVAVLSRRPIPYFNNPSRPRYPLPRACCGFLTDATYGLRPIVCIVCPDQRGDVSRATGIWFHRAITGPRQERAIKPPSGDSVFSQSHVVQRHQIRGFSSFLRKCEKLRESSCIECMTTLYTFGETNLTVEVARYMGSRPPSATSCCRRSWACEAYLEDRVQDPSAGRFACTATTT